MQRIFKIWNNVETPNSHVLEEEIYRGRSAVMSAQRQAAMTAIDSKAAKEKKTTAEKKKSMVAETQALYTFCIPSVLLKKY